MSGKTKNITKRNRMLLCSIILFLILFILSGIFIMHDRKTKRIENACEIYDMNSLSCMRDNVTLITYDRGRRIVRYCGYCGNSAYEVGVVHPKYNGYCSDCDEYSKYGYFCKKCGKELEHFDKESWVQISSFINKEDYDGFLMKGRNDTMLFER